MFRPESVMAQTVEVTPDGWIVTDLSAFRVLIDHAPPRPWGYWDQICCDVHEPKIICIWVVGVGFVVAGIGLAVAAVVTGVWFLLLGVVLLYEGLQLLVIWARLARCAVHSIRADPVATGVVGGLEPHPIVPQVFSVGHATRSSGDLVDVVIEVSLARAINQTEMPTEVWFLDDPNSQHRTVFAVRPVGGVKPAVGEMA
jgi:hypothetical protein